MPIPVPDDFDKVKEGFEPLPAGKYLVEVTDAEEKETSGDGKTPKGTPMIAFELTVADADEDWAGRKLWMNVVFGGKSLGMAKSTLRALGATDADFESGSEINAEDFIGKQAYAMAAVGRNPKTEMPNNNVKRLMPLSEEESELPG